MNLLFIWYLEKVELKYLEFLKMKFVSLLIFTLMVT